jgi:hypothetical protein
MNAPASSTVRDALQGQTLEAFDAAQFEALGGKLYYSLGSAMNQVDIHTMVETFRSVHAPSYGQFIPQSSAIVSETIEGGGAPSTIMAPSNNEVLVLSQLIFTNETLGNAAVTASINVGINTMQILAETVALGSTKVVTFYNVVKLDSNATLTVNADVEITATGYTYKVVQ